MFDVGNCVREVSLAVVFATLENFFANKQEILNRKGHFKCTNVNPTLLASRIPQNDIQATTAGAVCGTQFRLRKLRFLEAQVRRSRPLVWEFDSRSQTHP